MHTHIYKASKAACRLCEFRDRCGPKVSEQALWQSCPHMRDECPRPNTRFIARLEGKLMELVDGARNFERWGEQHGYEIRQAIRRPRATCCKWRLSTLSAIASPGAVGLGLCRMEEEREQFFFQIEVQCPDCRSHDKNSSESGFQSPVGKLGEPSSLSARQARALACYANHNGV